MLKHCVPWQSVFTPPNLLKVGKLKSRGHVGEGCGEEKVPPLLRGRRGKKQVLVVSSDEQSSEHDSVSILKTMELLGWGEWEAQVNRLLQICLTRKPEFMVCLAPDNPRA